MQRLWYRQGHTIRKAAWTVSKIVVPLKPHYKEGPVDCCSQWYR